MAEGGASKMMIENPFEILIQNLAVNNKVICKSQQKDELDLTTNEKITILTDILNENKAKFLFRFGQFLNADELKLFEQFQYNPSTGYEIAYHLQHIHRYNSTNCIKNRRYAAVKRLSSDNYFSEKEMRLRNPLLYDQLVGVYLSAKEKQIRDVPESTLVGAVMAGIDKEEAEFKRIQQEEDEDAAMEEDDSSSCSENEQPGPSKPNNPRLFWGEIHDESEPKKIKKAVTDTQLSITAQERKLLQEEFQNTMLESFLEGKDDIDYSTIDNNEEYDNLEILNRDEEEKYFDSEEVDDGDATLPDVGKNESSDDELEAFMDALHQRSVVNNLTEAMKNL